MTLSYSIAMSQPHTHLYEVTFEVDTVAGPALDVALPVWTPGSYMVREYARHVQEFQAEAAGGARLPWRKIDKSTWRIDTAGATHITIRYKVYAFELSVRTSHLDGTHGFFTPATVCMYVPGRTSEPHAVQVVAPEGWRVTTGLEPRTENREPQDSLSSVLGSWFSARDYDELVDSPFECGTHRLLEFSVDGVPHEIALWGHGNEDEAQIVADTQKIVETARDMFGGLPYTRYVFIVHLSDARGGGLEHGNSVAMLVDRWTFQPCEAYERYLSLTAHEFFHVWNVKRIRAEPLGPFDYSRENYTRQLWAMEGVTDHYTDLLLLRAGLIDGPRYLELVAEKIAALQGQPGRTLQSLEQSSFDAWIKLYRPDENTPNTSISYYLKGGLVALLLDLELREHTGGDHSLDDVLRALFERYPLDGPGIPEDGGYRAAIEQVAPGTSFAELFERYIAGVDELNYERALGYAGLRLDWKHERASDQVPAWLGIRTKNEHGHFKVTHVLANGPAYAAGIYAGDELLALDGFRLDEGKLKARLAEHSVGDTVTFSLFRRDELLHVPVRLAAAPADKLALVPREDATPGQRRIYEGWIGSWPEPAESRT